MSSASILVVDDEADIRETIRDILADEGYAVRVAANGAEARDEVRRARPDLVLLDVWMPDIDGISLLREWAEAGAPRCPVVILSGHGTVETAVEATRLGAMDFVEKPLSLTKLLRTVQRALEQRPEPGRAAMATQTPVGRSSAMRELRERAQGLARRPEPVLLLGEAASGRSVMARYIHALGGDERPWVELAAAAVPDANAAAVLLGTGSPAAAGALAQAAGGTLLLRDVQDFGPAAQQLLAGVLAQGAYAALGASVPRTLDTRLMASATPDGLTRLRPDLRLRLGAHELLVPPLRDRADDVPELLRHAVEVLVETERLPFRRFGLAAQNRLRLYPWPGNVLELEVLVRRLLLAGGGEEILLPELEQNLVTAIQRAEPLVKQDLLALPLREAREQFERAYLTEQLALCGGRVGALAKRVGMERTHLYRKLRTLGVDFRHAHDDD
jgi:DNA-binding NtrC family response regulator